MTLERAANIALMLTCVAVAGQLGYINYARSTASTLAAPYRAGERIVDTPDLSLRTQRTTLLLMTASTCHFCAESMPFYRRLTAAAGKAGVRVVAVSRESPARNRAYLAENGVLPAAVGSMESNHLRGEATPVLVLVGKDGIVAKTWAGKLGSNSEQEVLDTVTRLSAL
jgi:peroxiredoxin